MATQARNAVLRRSAAVSSWVMTRYVGTTAIGSTMNSIAVSVTRAKRDSSSMGK